MESERTFCKYIKWQGALPICIHPAVGGLADCTGCGHFEPGKTIKGWKIRK